uniref:C2H2-type domain-containing protein n=1 Tax=Acrobeloides nanus TaxID=290746 RepID=A0A914CR81_9BILA
MINEASYIEIMKNCSKWNNRIVSERKRVSAVLDQQTGVLEKPTHWLYRSYQDRFPPAHPQEVCTYAPQPYRKPAGVSSDAIEMKYFLNTNPALNEAINSITNSSGLNQSLMNDSNSDSLLSMRGNGNKSVYDDLESGDIYDMDEPENDPSDEDDWGDRRTRKRKRGETGGGRGGGRPSKRLAAGGSSSSNNVSQVSSYKEEPKPFVCPHCGVKYKSRPGLTYHKLHVHMDNGNESPKSP